MSGAGTFRVLPGFGLTLGYTLVYLSLLILIPLAAVFIKSAELSWEQFVAVVTAPQVVATYRLSFGTSLLAAVINAVFGLLLAWALVRYRFPGKKLVDALVDLPFALPTAVAGIALTALYSGNGWLGQYLEPLGIKVAFSAARGAGGAGFHRPAFRRAHGAADPRGSRYRDRRGGGQPRGPALADLPPRDPADPAAGLADRLRAGFRAGGRRVRLGHLHRRQSALRFGNHAADDHYQAGAIRLSGRDRHRRGDACWFPSCCC